MRAMTTQLPRFARPGVWCLSKEAEAEAEAAEIYDGGRGTRT